MDGTLFANEGVEPKELLKRLDSNTCPPIALRLQTGKKPYINGHIQDDNDREKQNGITIPLQHSTSGLFRLPLELRLEIYRHVFGEIPRICPHSNLPMVVLAREVVSRSRYYYWIPISRCQVLPNLIPAYLDTPLPVLGLSGQINAEVGESCVVFLEKCFTHFNDRPYHPFSDNDTHKVKEILRNYDADVWRFVRRLGFSINQLPDSFEIDPDEEIVRFRNGLRWMDQHMPRLEYTYISLFVERILHSRKSFNTFLSALIISLKAMKGQKVITVRGTNKAKIAVAKQWKHQSQGEPILITGGCQCATWYDLASTYPSRQYYRSDRTNIHVGGVNCGTEHKGKISWEGSLIRQRTHQSKGPLVGCLLCRTKTMCEHDPKYNPKRQTPTLSRSGKLLKP